MSITLSALQKQRRDTAANWTAENPTLLAGEIGLESDTGYWKVGNGSSAWNSLAYVPGLGAELPVSRLADGTARQLLQTAANGTDVEWTSNVDVPGTLDVTGAATFDSSVTITGDLTVNGTTTNINTQNLVVEDKNVILGDVATPTDVTADGGGITLKGTTDKTINWIDATDAWTLSEHVNIANGKEYRINGIKVLDATSLGSSVLITSANITDGTIVNGDVSASAAIAGTKISPDFGSQNVTTTGTATAAALIPSGSSVPTNGVYLPSANNVAISTNSSQRLLIDASGNVNIDSNTLYVDATNNRVGLGTGSPSNTLHVVGNSYFTTGAQVGSGTDYASLIPGAVSFYNASASSKWIKLVDDSSTINAIGFSKSGSAATVWFPSGNVGIGTQTPSELLDVVGSGVASIRAYGGFLSAGFLEAAGNADTVQVRLQSNTNDAFVGTLTNHSLYFQTNNSERARIDSSGRLLVGTSSTSANTRAVIQGRSGGGSGVLYLSRDGVPGDGGGLGYLQFSDNAQGDGAYVGAERDGGTWTSGSSHPSRLVFSTTADGASSPTEHARITQGGYLKASSNGTYDNTTGIYNEYYQAGNSFALLLRAVGASTYTSSALGIGCDRNTSNSTYNFILCGVSGVADRFIVRDSGNVVNANNSYGAISDIKLKKNIVDANSQWDDLKALKVRKYNFKEDQTHTQIGLIAQEAELVSPGIVNESPDRDEEGNDLGTVTKSVNYSVLYMKAVKALQEAMERIEQLETEMAEVKAQLQAS